MGCWNATCGISNLAITYGSDVVCIPILLENSRNEVAGQCYIDDMYSPFCLPIFGKYNDYGAMENIILDETAKSTLRIFNEMLIDGCISVRAGDHEKEVPVFDDLEHVIDTIERGRVFVKVYNGKAKLDLFYVHRHIYDGLVKQYGERVPYKSEECIRELLLKSYEKMQVAVKDGMSNEDGYLFAGDYVRRKFGFYSAAIGQVNGLGLKKYFALEMEEHVQHILDFIMLKSSMTVLRKPWVHQCGVGGQDQEHVLHLALTDLIGEQVEIDLGVRRKVWEEDGYDGEVAPYEETIFWHERG